MTSVNFSFQIFKSSNVSNDVISNTKKQASAFLKYKLPKLCYYSSCPCMSQIIKLDILSSIFNYLLIRSQPKVGL